MTNKKSIRRAVLSSALALILCFTSLIGTTFAWFTDEVTSGRNLIVAGNLDVDLDYMDDNGGWKDIESATDLFKDSLWEPGKVQYVNLKVANVGTLALNYKLMINFFGENCVLDEQGQLTDLRLSDVIKVAYVEGGVEVTGTEEEQRAAAIKLGEQVGFGDIDTTAVTGKVYPDGNVDGKAVEVEYGVILYWAPNDDATDNLYNLNNGKAASTIKYVDGVATETTDPSDKLIIELGVKLEATQLTYENDSFGNKYDANILECDILATPETIDEILATASEGTVIGLAAGKYGSITLTQNNLTLITNTAVVDYVNANAKENCKLIGITFDAAGAQKGYDPKNGQLSFYTSVASGENVSSGADYLEIIDCTFTGTPVDASNYCVISFYDRQRVSGATEGFTVEDCTFETDAAYYIYAYYPGYNVKGTIEIIDNTFGTANTSVNTAVYLGSIKAHAVVRNNTFVNNGVVVTPHNNASCTYALNVEVSYNHFINTSDADTTAIALRNFYGLPKCTTTVKDNTANYGKSVIKDPYIDTQFYECYDVTTAPADFKMASNAAELTSAIESATEDITIMLMSDITATVTAKQNADVDVVIDGQGYECSETIYLHGQARHTGAETLTIKNINFVSDTAIDFISANSTESTERYAHNVTVENCTFKGTGTGDVVGLRLRQTYNITIKNCTADGMHSLLWATGGDGITVDNVTVTNSKHGVSFGTTKNAVVKNCNFTSTDAYGYGIRANASGAYSLTVENSTIKAAAPILLREATGTYAATLSGNTLTATGAYQIIVTAGDFEEGKDLTAPTGVCTLTGADGLTVYKG